MDSAPLHVVINGKLYVPVVHLEGQVTIEAIGQALLTAYWGEVEKTEIAEKMDGLKITLTEDSGEDGLSWQEFLRVLAEKNAA